MAVPEEVGRMTKQGMKPELSAALFDFCARAHDALLAASGQIKYKSDDPQQVFAVSLFGSILQITGDIVALKKAGRVTSIPMLLRTVVEAHVDLRNLAQNKAYWKVLVLESQQQWMDMVIEAKRGTNEYLKGISGMPDREQITAAMGKDIKALEKEGVKRLSIHEKFEAVGMDNEYGAVYKHLCGHSHNGASALIERHARGSRDFNNLAFYDEPNLAMVETFFVLLIGYLLTSAALANDILDKPISTVVETLAREFKALEDQIGVDMGYMKPEDNPGVAKPS